MHIVYFVKILQLHGEEKKNLLQNISLKCTLHNISSGRMYNVPGIQLNKAYQQNLNFSFSEVVSLYIFFPPIFLLRIIHHKSLMTLNENLGKSVGYMLLNY